MKVVGFVIGLLTVSTIVTIVALNKPLGDDHCKRYKLTVYPLAITFSMFTMVYTGYNLANLDLQLYLGYALVLVLITLSVSVLVNATVTNKSKFVTSIPHTITVFAVFVLAFYCYSVVYKGETEGKLSNAVKAQQEVKVKEITEQVKAKEFREYCTTDLAPYFSVCSNQYNEYIKEMYIEPNKGKFVDFHYTLNKELSYLEHEIKITGQKYEFLSQLAKAANKYGNGESLVKTITDEQFKQKELLDSMQKKIDNKEKVFETVTKQAYLNFEYMYIMGFAGKDVEFKPVSTLTTEFDTLTEFDLNTYIDKALSALKVNAQTLEWGEQYKQGNAS